MSFNRHIENPDVILIGSGEEERNLLLAAYEKWGAECPARLLGDFAYAVWDIKARRLFCARDHFGSKPLYYFHQPGKFIIFASQITAILCHPANYRFPQPMRLHPSEPFFCYAPQQLGDMEIKPGEPYIARYRFVTADGAMTQAEIDRLWDDYAAGK